jgi:hypothetical protein
MENAPHQNFQVISPEGDRVGVSTTKGGAPAKLQWQSFDNIANAVSALDNDSLPNISASLGQNHKVRSFYNNIIDPSNPDHVTIDTHAIAAGLLQPLGSAHARVNLGLGTVAPANNATGAKALYGLYHEAYTRAADELGILQRELQSATWEGVRGLFPSKFKTTNNIDATDNIWNDVTNGNQTADQARASISELAGGISPPTWAEPGGGAAPQAQPAFNP